MNKDLRNQFRGFHITQLIISLRVMHIIALLALFIIAGCQRHDNVPEITESDLLEDHAHDKRAVERFSPFTNLTSSRSRGEVNSNYRVSREDVIEIWAPAKGSIKLSNSFNDLISDRAFIRLPVDYLLRSDVESLEYIITVKNHTPYRGKLSYQKYLKDIEDRRIPWSKLKSDITDSNTKGMVYLMPNAETFVTPGDQVIIRRSRKVVATTSSNQVPSVDDYTTFVNSAGMISLPVTFGVLTKDTRDPSISAYGQLDIADRLLSVWRPGSPISLERLTNQLCPVVPSVTIEGKNLGQLQERFILVSPPRTWTLVTPDGKALPESYVLGQTVADGIQKALDSIGQLDLREVAVRVTPDNRLWPEQQWRAVYQRGKPGILAKTLLRQGDVVVLSKD